MMQWLKINESVNSFVDGEITFVGTLINHLEEISRGWNQESTKKIYANDYLKIILPEIPNIGLSSLGRVDFEQALERIKNKGRNKPMSEERMRHFFILIERVLDAAERHYGYPNVLNLSAGNIAPSATTALSNRRGLRVPHILSEQEKIKASNFLFSDVGIRGEFVALAIMFVCGTRPAEACGLNFGDMVLLSEQDEAYVLIISKTSASTLDSLQISGKTRNAPRKIPVTSLLADFLLKRKAWVAEQLPAGIDIDTVPMVCVRNEFTKRANTDAIDRVGDEFFNAIGMETNKLIMIRHELMKNPQEEEDLRAATPYVLRRDFATDMKALGMNDAMLKYIMGHDLSGENETKAYLQNDDMLMSLRDIMLRRQISYSESQMDTVSQPLCIDEFPIESEFYENITIEIDESVDEVVAVIEPSVFGMEFRIESDTINLIDNVEIDTLSGKVAKELTPASSGYRKNFFRKARALMREYDESADADDLEEL